jgi:PAS domain S-box-containing protein
MEASLAELVNHVPVMLRRPQGEILHWSQGCSELFGFSANEACGRNSHDLLQTVFPEPSRAIEAALDQRGVWRGRLHHTAKSGQQLWTEAALRLRNAGDPPTAVIVEQYTDITLRVELEERSALLTRELEHRVKNVLSVVQALARMTFRGAPAEQRKKMDERIGALAEANSLLQAGSWKEADLRSIVNEVAGRLGIEEHLRIEGPDIAVSSGQAMNLALAIHELCTNALKYGALSQDGGWVEVSWGTTIDENVQLRWLERGGPPVRQPSGTGFGMRLIRKALSIDARAPAEVRFGPDGVTWHLFLRRS